MKIQSINSFERINISKKQSDKSSPEISTESSLSTPETMRAFKAYAVTFPNFKNLSMPIEVTDKYNKKVEGKDHLDLPNIHVYEYPDTNLRVMLSVNPHINAENSSPLDELQILYYIKRNNIQDDVKNQKDNKIKEKIEQEIKKISSEFYVGTIVDTDNVFLGYSKLFGQDMLDDMEIVNNTVLNPEFKDKELENYYESIKKDFSMDVYVTVSKEYYEKNKNKIFNSLNKGINFKLQKENISKNEQEITNNIVNDLSMNILKMYKGNNNIDILEEDLENILNEIKLMYKSELKEFFTSEHYMPLMRNVKFAYYGTSIFNIYEIIDAITEQEVKNYIETYFVNQPPVVEVVENVTNS